MTNDPKPTSLGERLIEMIAVLLLGIATVGTAWCGYQSSQWNGAQSDLARTASDQRVEASRLFGLATQQVSYDASSVAQYAQAVQTDSATLSAVAAGGRGEVADRSPRGAVKVPTFRAPEAAARALGRAADVGVPGASLRHRPVSQPPDSGL